MSGERVLFVGIALVGGVMALLFLRVAGEQWALNRRNRKRAALDRAARSAALRDELIGAAAPALDAPGAAGEAEGHSVGGVDAGAVPDAAQLGIDVDVTIGPSGGKPHSGEAGRSGPVLPAVCVLLSFASCGCAVSLGGSTRLQHESEPALEKPKRPSMGSASPAAVFWSERQPADSREGRVR